MKVVDSEFWFLYQSVLHLWNPNMNHHGKGFHKFGNFILGVEHFHIWRNNILKSIVLEVVSGLLLHFISWFIILSSNTTVLNIFSFIDCG